MAAYADIGFYTSKYLVGAKAVIPFNDFAHYANKASRIIDNNTFDNLNGVEPENIPGVVKMCCCELAEMLYKSDSSPISKGITNEKVGDVSVSYASADSSGQVMPTASTVNSILRLWLADSGLLYRGVSLC